MNIGQAFKMSLSSIWSNKMRSFLTMLGIIIGVSAVIIMVSIIQGTTSSILGQIESMGTNLVTVTLTGKGSSKTITMDDMYALAKKYPDVIDKISPSISGNTTIKVGTENGTTSLLGVNEQMKTIQNLEVESGRFILSNDVENLTPVTVIGTYIAKTMFPEEKPIGQKIKINGRLFTIVGVLEEKQSSSQGGSDDKVIIPYTVAQRLLKNTTIRSFSIQAKTRDATSVAKQYIENFLMKKLGNKDAYRVFSSEELLETISTMTGTMTAMLGGIAGISLLVGGIGIMNIMLVSVTERTREIGIRKAIGARRGSILTQFLIEAIVVSVFGGIIGIIIGVFGGIGIGNLIKITAKPTAMVMLLSMGFSVAVGVFFGWYPANKASKLNPIDALRYE